MVIDQDGNIAFWVAVNGSATGDGTEHNPFNSIASAQLAVRALLQSSEPLTRDIVVNIGGGTYQLAQPLSFGAADSGRDGHVVHYRAVPGEHPELSGGLAVTHWTPVDNSAIQPGARLWAASVGTGVDSRQLYVDGVRATIAETNDETTYPVGFRPTFYDLPGISGIEYAAPPSGAPDSRNPVTWTNVNDIEAVIYDQWKMASVPLKQVLAPSPSIPSLNPVDAPSVGLITLLDPAWTNANLVRGLATGTITADPTTIVLDGALAAPQIRPGMTVIAAVPGTDIPLGTVTQVDVASNTIKVSAGQSALVNKDVALSIIDPVTHEQVTGQTNIWGFWRVSKFINAYQFLDKPNEWYLDKATGTLYLVTDASINPNQHDIVLPVQEKLIDGSGASNLAFEGLTFKYATWLGPSRVVDHPGTGPTADGYVSDQAGFHLTGDGHEVNQFAHFQVVTRTPGNISFDHGVNITFSDNVFSHMGGVGLDFTAGAQGNRVSHNIFQDISSAAVQLGGVNAPDARPLADADVTRNNSIDGNIIKNVGAEFFDAPGINVGYAQNTRIDGNFISDVPWAGISLGWGWGMRDQWIAIDPASGLPVEMGSFPGLDSARPGEWGFNTTPTIMRDNQIVGNTITRFLQKSWDGGAVYTVGFQDGDPLDLGLHGTVITDNYFYGKTPGGGGNVIYTDGGSRNLEIARNILFGNPTGHVDFGPLFSASDGLNKNYSLAGLPQFNALLYGSDIGGCDTFGDILYAGNRWENLWLANVFNQNPALFPFNPLFYDPGTRGDTGDPLHDKAPLPGAPYPTDLEFLSNIQVAGPWGAALPNVSVDDVFAFVRPTALSVLRGDDKAERVSFGLQSLDDAHVVVLLEDAEARSANALSYNGATEAAWRLSEGQHQGSATSLADQMAAGLWLPVAERDGQKLALLSLQADGNSALATFDGGYQFNVTLGGSRSIANGQAAEHPMVTIKRLGAFDNGIAFYEADRSTGRIEVDGQSLMPGDPGYLQGALALAHRSDLVLDAHQLPAFGQQIVRTDLPLSDTRNYGLLLLVNNDPTHLLSSYAAANPGGAVQVMALGDSGQGITFGLEDQLTNIRSDRDFNDLLVTIGHFT